MKKKKLPLNPDGSVDFTKIDPSNDFDLFPPMFSCPEDIEKFIHEENLQWVLLSVTDILQARKNKKLEITPTEDQFYFGAMFDYIYDVFRVPVPETRIKVKDWLDEYVCENLRLYGFEYFKKVSFDRVRRDFDRKVRFEKFITERNIDFKGKEVIREINCYREIPVGENWGDFHVCYKPELIEQFWIRSSMIYCPFWMPSEEEAYMRVWVFPDRVYIFGQDDASWTLTTNNEEKSKEFARYLKCTAPVWNFEYIELIHPELKFTN